MLNYYILFLVCEVSFTGLYTTGKSTHCTDWVHSNRFEILYSPEKLR